MSSPPQTPMHRPTSSHRRHPSSLDMAHNPSSRRHSLNRRSSGYSPITPRSSQDFEHGSPAQQFDGGGEGNGLGNLADELGEIWDDDEEPMDGDFGEDLDNAQDDDDSGIGTAVEHDGSYGLDSPVNLNGVRDSGVAMQSSSPARLSPGSAMKTRKHIRQRSMYDGSDYGEDSDLENEGISHTLDLRMSAIESLVRRGTEDNGSASDQVIKRVIEHLRDLGSQMAIENGATRLKTAHDALTTHLSHQSRTLTSLAASFSGPRPIIPDLDTIEDLLPLIDSTLELLPHSSADPLIQIANLTNSTRELLQHLSNVSDTLHMSRQITSNATRRLKVSKEQLQDWKRENAKTQEGQDYIEHGDWDRRLREREAKRACDEVLDGFEDVCGQWRKRLCEGLGVANDEFLESSEDVGPSWRTTARVINAPDSLSELVQFLSVETTSTSHHPLQLQPHKQSSTTDSMFPTPSDDLDSPFSELLSLSLTRGTDSA